MDCGSSQDKIEFKWIETGSLRPNPWNPNRMSPETAAKLAAEVRRKGMILPLVVRPIENYFQIIDGEHRWLAATQMGMAALPCIVVDLDESEARLKTIQLNRLRGEDEPELLARLLRELNVEMGVEQLESRLPFDKVEIEQSMDLLEMKESESSRKQLEREMEEMSKDRIFSVVVSEQEKASIERAIFHAQSSCNSSRPGTALAKICEDYLALESKA